MGDATVNTRAFHAVDSRATAGASTDASSSTDREWGALSLSYFVDDRKGLVWRANAGGVYRLYNAGEPDSGSFLLDRASLTLRYKSRTEAEAGAMWMFGLFPASRVLGARARYGVPRLSAEIFGGRGLHTAWDSKGPSQKFGAFQAGAIVRNSFRSWHNEMGVRRDFAVDDEEGSNYLAHRINFAPGRRKLIFSNGLFYETESGAFEAKPGAAIFIRPSWSAGVAYSYTNLPPFYESVENLGRYIAHRGEVTTNFRLKKSRTFALAVQAGTLDAGAMAGIYSPRIGAQIFYRANFEGDSRSGGGYLYGRYPIRPWLSLEPSATTFYNLDDLSGRGGINFDGGLRAVAVPFDWLEASIGGEYVNTMAGGRGDEVIVSANLSVPLGRSNAGARAGTSPIRYGALYSEPRHRPINAPRPFGKVMMEAVPEFNHRQFFDGGHDAKDSVCGTCHTPSASFKIATLRRKGAPCGDCHDTPVTDEKGLKLLEKFIHPGNITGQECESCHIDMKFAEKPTGGIGAIIRYPNAHEVYAGSRGWKGHGQRQDNTCPTCHSGTVQFENQTVVSCADCHSTTSNTGAVAMRGHPESWKKSGRHGLDYKSNPTTCTTCHDVKGGECMSCHTGETSWGERPAIASGMHNQNDGFTTIRPGHGIGHGELAKRTGGAECAPCHADKEKPGQARPACNSCH